MKRWHGIMLAAVAAGAAAAASGCSDDTVANDNAGAAGSGGSAGSGAAGSGGSGGGSAGSASGGMPPDGKFEGPCKPSSAECYVDGADGPGNQCLALVDNSESATYQLRVSQLQIESPPALQAPFLQDSIVTQKITPPRPNCIQDGDGQFTVLFDIDPATKTFKQGASFPQALVGDIADGACFATFMDAPTGKTVQPVTTAYEDRPDGTIRAVFDEIAIPIFIEDSKTDYALLPLRELEVTARLSSDSSCIGHINGDNLDPMTCEPKPDAFAFDNGGTYAGYVTVEDADKVDIATLGYTLCVLLSGDAKRWLGPKEPTPAGHLIGRCAKSKGFMEDGGLPKGNWCAATNSAATADCDDAWLIKTQFAASAVKITGDCP